MNEKLKSGMTDQLFSGVLTLQTIEECYAFFEDVCTVNEIHALAQRVQVAKMLLDKKTYSEVAESTGASTATISRVNRCINYGNGGYKTVIERLNEKKQ